MFTLDTQKPFFIFRIIQIKKQTHVWYFPISNEYLGLWFEKKKKNNLPRVPSSPGLPYIFFPICHRFRVKSGPKDRRRFGQLLR